MDASWHGAVHGKEGRWPTHPSPWVIADGRAVQGGMAQVLQDMSPQKLIVVCRELLDGAGTRASKWVVEVVSLHLRKAGNAVATVLSRCLMPYIGVQYNLMDVLSFKDPVLGITRMGWVRHIQSGVTLCCLLLHVGSHLHGCCCTCRWDPSD